MKPSEQKAKLTKKVIIDSSLFPFRRSTVLYLFITYVHLCVCMLKPLSQMRNIVDDSIKSTFVKRFFSISGIRLQSYDVKTPDILQI